MSLYNHSKPPLPEDYTPSEHDVVVGKGKKFCFHPGNVALRAFVSSPAILAEYSKAHLKAAKSEAISNVVCYVNQKGAFVTKNPLTGRFVYATDRLCREKCSQTFRDALHETYRSSSVSKKNKRRREQQEAMHRARGATSSAIKTSTQDNKRMHVMDPVHPAVISFPSIEPSRPAPISVRSNPFDMMDVSLTTKAMKRGSLPSQSEDNFVALITETLGLPCLDEEDAFEPTPLKLDGNIDADSIFGLIDATPLSCKKARLEEFAPLSCESASSLAQWFQDDESLDKVPNVSTAYAA